MPGRRHARAADLITPDDRARLDQAQGGVCAICGHPPKRVALNVDHQHGRKDRRVRGLLCHRCNRAIPAWATVEWFEKALAYLRRPPAFAVLGTGEYDSAPMDGES